MRSLTAVLRVAAWPRRIAGRVARDLARFDHALTLQEKLLLPVLVMVGLGVTCGALAATKLVEERSFASYREQALIVAAAVQSDIDAVGGLADLDHLQAHFSFLVQSVPSLRRTNVYVVQDGQPIIAASSDVALLGQAADSHDVAPIYGGGTATGETRLGDEPVLELVNPIFVDGRPAASVGVYQSLAPHYAAVRSQQRLILLIGGLAAAASIGIITVSIRQLVLVRLRRLLAAQERLAAGDLAVRVDGSWSPAARDEVARAICHFNATTDILQTAYQTMERLATIDSLTGLYNHRHLWDVLEGEVARARRLGYPLGLLFLDVDHFKRVNDRFGHTVGDEVLRRLGQLLRRHLRDTDLACRYGGDEFVILLPGCALAASQIVGEKLRRAINEALDDGDDEWTPLITVSVGVASLPQNAETAEELIQQADLAHYEAKATGRDRVASAQGTAPVN